MATSLLYGDSEERRYAALSAHDPLALPWIRAHLDRLTEVLGGLLDKGPAHAATVVPVRREVARSVN